MQQQRGLCKRGEQRKRTKLRCCSAPRPFYIRFARARLPMRETPRDRGAQREAKRENELASVCVCFSGCLGGGEHDCCCNVDVAFLFRSSAVF